MSLKLKSVLYPPDTTATNQRRQMSRSYEHCVIRIEDSVNLFFFYFNKTEFSGSEFFVTPFQISNGMVFFII